MQKSRRQNVEKVKTIVYYRFITHHYSYGGNYMFTIENFIHGIANVTKSLKASICGDSLIVNRICYDYETSNDYEELFAQISLEQIQPIIELLADNYICTDKMLIKNDYIEIAVQSQDRNRPTAFMRLDRDSFEVTEHNYHFITSKASQEYIFALLCSFHNTPDKYEVSSMRLFPKEIITNFEDFCDTFRICTVKVTSPQNHSITEFKRIFDAYLFNIAYNFNVPLAVSDFTDMRKFRRIRTRRNGQLFPYKQYKQDLTKYYQQALATNLPFMQYLAFYHVAEFFFQSISEDEAFHVIASFITRPSFSPYRYEPFKHDKHLGKEIPLMRAVAEEIIISSADRINYSFVDPTHSLP